MTGNLEVDGIIEIDKTGDHPALRFVEDGSNTRAYMGSGDWAINGLANDDFGISSSSTGDLVLGTGAGSERLRIDNPGRVTTPNQPNFIFQGSYNNWTTINQSGQWLPFTGSTGVATSTNYEIAMNWTSSRTGGYNPSGNGINANTGVYTAPVTGTYMFTFQTYMLKGAAGSGYVHINSFINGSNQDDYTIYGYGLSAGVYVQPEITKVIRMSANDTFGFRLYTNVSDYKIYPHYTCLTGYLLG